jgi:hypothetical protein
VTAFLGDDEPRLCRQGAVAFAPAGCPHSFRVESDTARMLFISTPAGNRGVRDRASGARGVAVAPAAARGPAGITRTYRRGRAAAGDGPPRPAAGLASDPKAHVRRVR